jgi:hypothetical protein
MLARILRSSSRMSSLAAMSALAPKADMDQHGRDVRFVPKADIMRCSNCACRYCKNWRIFASSWRGLKGFGTHGSFATDLWLWWLRTVTDRRNKAMIYLFALQKS